MYRNNLLMKVCSKHVENSIIETNKGNKVCILLVVLTYRSYILNILVKLIILYIIDHLQQNVKSVPYLHHLTFHCGSKLKKWDTAVIINALGQSTYLIWLESPKMPHSRQEVWGSLWSCTTYSTPHPPPHLVG